MFGAKVTRLRSLTPLACASALGSLGPIEPSAAQPLQNDVTQAGTPSAAGDRAAALDSIVVTARRRQEDLQRVPVSVMVISGKELDAHSLSNLGDLQKFIPNLTFAPAQNVGDAAGNVFIRGIGQEDFAAGTEAGVGLYLDGVYLGRTVGTMLDLVDIARVEVLRGPQGTLYGRNAIGGAINVLSVSPQARPAGTFDLSLGNYDRVSVRGMINAPISERLLLRVAGNRLVHDGYMHRANPPFAPTTYAETNLAPEGADDRYSGRVQLRWLADDTLTVDLAADASRRRGTQTPTHLDAVNPQAIGSNLATVNRLVREGVLPGPEITNALVSPDLLVSNAGGGNRIAQNIVGVSLNADKIAGDQDIHLTLAYRRLRSNVATDADGTWFNLLSSVFDEKANQYSAELRTSGSKAALTYTAGVFAYHESGRVLPVTGAGQDVLYFCGCLYSPQTRPRTLFPARQIVDTSYAAYAQGTLRLGSRLSTTFGARYSIDHKSVDAQLVLLDPTTLTPTSQIVGTGANRGHWSSFTWRLGAEFQASRDVLVYVSAARGFKSGGFNVRPVVNLVNLGLAPYAPETATAYEVGLRSQWFADRLRFNLTLFQTDYRDIQLRQQTILGGVVTTLVENAARARIRGIELEVTGRPVTGLTLSVAYGYVDPRYLEIGSVPGLTLASDFQRTPHHSLTASSEYRLALGSGVLALNADYSYRSHEQFQITATPWDQSGYGLLGARLAWHAPGDRWSCALFGTNLADRRYRTAGRGTLLGSAGFAYSEIGPPRQLGVQIKIAY